MVDELEVVEELKVKGLCEDCIFRKQTVQLYYENLAREKEVLKRVYIDL